MKTSPHLTLFLCRMTLCSSFAMLAGSLATALPADATSGERYRCRSVPEAIDMLRASGLEVAYSEGLVSERMLVRRTPTAEDSAGLLQEIVGDYGLEVKQLPGKSLSIVPSASQSVERLRRISSPLLVREDSYDALPEWRNLTDIGRSVAFISFVEGSGTAAAPSIDQGVDFIIWRLPERLGDKARAAFELKQQIVATGSRAPTARMGLEGSRAVVEALMDRELAPYVDGYVFERDPWVPELDATGRPWWKTSLASASSDTLLELLLDGARKGAAFVLVQDRGPNASESGLLDAVRATGAGALEDQPQTASQERINATVFLEPRSGNFQVAVYNPSGGGRVSLELEPGLEARVIYPQGEHVATDSYGRFVALQFPGGAEHWLIELEKSRDLARAGEALVEDEVIVDPYEVVVRNQIFQRAEVDKVLSVDVMEYASVTPGWRNGRRSFWEHRIFQRRGRLDEYLHLEVYRDGVRLPRDKMYKSILGRPVERIELAPLTVENRKTYRYRYLGSDEIDGHPTWKIGFDPVVPGRLVSGVIWIDQVTGAHRQIRAKHHNLGVGILSGDYITRYRWIPGPDGCHWDWDRRYGSETYDYLDFEGVAQIDYKRENFRYNRADIEEVIQAAHESDVLIHVATPPEGHRWLLRGAEIKPKRGDLPYEDGVLRVEDMPEVKPDSSDEELPLADEPAIERQAERPAEEAPGPALTASLGSATSRGEGDALTEMLAGPWAFPSRSRISVGYFGNSSSDSDLDFGFNFLDWDFLRRGRKGRDPLYLWIGGFGEDGLVSLTDPHLFGSEWSLTGSFDLQLDPDQDFLFRQNTETPGDESTVSNLSLDSRKVGFRFSFGRPLTGSVSMRLKLGVHSLNFMRKSGTDPNFILPANSSEVTLRSELSWSRRSTHLVLGLEGGRRGSDWRAWGLDGRQEAIDQWSRYDARLTWAHPIGRSQTLAASLGIFGGSDLDRFSRRRLFEVDARVPGYSSSIGFDEGTHVSVSYNFRVWKLPLRLRTDYAELNYDVHELEPELVDQELLGTQLNLNLHGPFRTDLLFGVGRALHAEPARAEKITSWWLIVSRRFGKD